MEIDNFTDYNKEDFDKTFNSSELTKNVGEVSANIKDTKKKSDEIYEI